VNLRKTLFFVTVASLMGVCFYFAWAWSRGAKDNAALRQQISVLASGYKNTEAAVSLLRQKEKKTESIRSVAQKDQKNLKASYVRALAQSQKLSQENLDLKARVEETKKAMEDAHKDAVAARNQFDVKDKLIALLNRRLHKLNISSRKLEEQKKLLAKELEKIRVEQKKAALTDKEASENGDSSDLQAEIRDLKKKNKELMETVRQTEKEAQDSKRAVAALQESNKEYEVVLNGAQKDLEVFQRSKEKIQRLEKETAVAHYNIGVLYMQQRQFRKAADEFEHALAINPADPLCHYNLAMLNDAYLGDAPKAIKHYEAYLKYSPQATDLQQVEYRIFQMRLELEKGLGREFGKGK
jgi:tetratricopeptide (TPR) repeat protein